MVFTCPISARITTTPTTPPPQNFFKSKEEKRTVLREVRTPGLGISRKCMFPSHIQWLIWDPRDNQLHHEDRGYVSRSKNSVYILISLLGRSYVAGYCLTWVSLGRDNLRFSWLARYLVNNGYKEGIESSWLWVRYYVYSGVLIISRVIFVLGLIIKFELMLEVRHAISVVLFYEVSGGSG